MKPSYHAAKVPKPNARPKQQTPQELTDDLLGFIRRGFYADDAKQFFQDRRLLLRNIVLWPAAWLNDRGVTIPPARYKEIFMAVILDAMRFGHTDQIKYRPAWLGRVIQSHFAAHGDELYEEAKALRGQVDQVIKGLPVPSSKEADPVRQMAEASALLNVKRTGPKVPVKAQLTLF